MSPNRTAMVRRILRLYRAAPAKIRNRAGDWYEAESDRLADLAFELGLPLRAVCGAAAAISPGMRWELVPDYVRALATAAEGEHVRVPTYSSLFTARALGCLRGEDPAEVLRGPKVTAFYRLLVTRGQSDDVVIDGHAYNIARGERAPLRGRAPPPAASRVTPARYRIAAEAYRAAAKALDIAPHSVQAITWTFWRSHHGIN